MTYSFVMTAGHFFLHLLASLAELHMHTRNHQFLWIYTFFLLGSIHLSPIIFCILSLCLHLFLLPCIFFVVSIHLYPLPLYWWKGTTGIWKQVSVQQPFAKCFSFNKSVLFLKEIQRKILFHSNHLWVTRKP